MLLYNSQVSGNCYKVRLLLAQLGLTFERRELDVVDRSNRAEVIGLDRNPALRVPTLILDDGRALPESGAILWYFAEGTPYLPEDGFERAQVLQWMFFEQYDIEPNIAVARFWKLFGIERPAAEVEAKVAAGEKALGGLEAHLVSHSFLVAERYTIADIALYGYTHVANEGGFDLTRYPAVQAWHDRVAAPPGHITITA